MKYLNRDINTQSGRSMVEMLGVLAVMGVLTIGGISGYNYAINKHHANQVLQDIRLIYQETKYPYTMAQIIDGNLPNEMELATISPYEYGLTIPDLKDFEYDSITDTTPNLISVNVLGVSETVCNILLKTKPEYTLMLKVNDETTWNCTQDENILSYIFEITADSLEYGKCSVCTGEYCFDDDMNCPKGETCQNNVCSKCAHGYTLTIDGNCYDCTKLGIYGLGHGRSDIDQENCLRCDNSTYSNSDKTCYSCNAMNDWEMTLEECNRCSHNKFVLPMETSSDGNVGCFTCKNFRYYPRAEKDQCKKCASFDDNIVFYPLDKEGKDTVGLCANCNMDNTGKMHKNTAGTACEGIEGYFWDITSPHSFVVSCDTEADRYTSKIECDRCPQRYYDIAKGGNDRYGPCKLCLNGQRKDTSPEGDGRRCVDAPAS